MLRKLRLIGKSARLYLWPAVAGNTIIMASLAGARIADSLLLGLSICCLASFGFLINDLHDRSVDRINSARRLEAADLPLVKTAWGSSVAFLLLGLSSSFAISLPSLILSLWLALGLVLYSLVIRRILLAANFLAALLGTSPLWAPLVLWQRNLDLFVPSLFLGIYLMFVAREIILDIKDEYGDRSVGRHTFATLYGGRIAGLLASLSTVAAGLVFFVAAVRASFSSSGLQAVLLWSIFVVFFCLVLVPALRASSSPSSLGAPKRMANYILCSRIAMIVLPVILGLVLLVD